ncbi:CocE/NonD family hydrolase [Bacteroidota bacterium]
MNKILLVFVFLLFAGIKFTEGQVLTPIVDSIPTRDGKMLAADVYLPDTGKTYPVILIQTPYNRLFYRLGLPLQIGQNLNNSPYAFVIVDWRCFYGSVGACKALPERGKDGYDVIDWISKQAWSNGKVGTWGPSALGKIQYLTAKEQHPNHICAVPMVAGSQFEYQEYYPNGVFRTEYVDQLDALGYNMKTALLQHPYYDAYWQYVENANMYPEKIKIPMLLIGGWFDHNIDLMFDLFDTLVKASDPAVRDLHKFLVGPWSHNSVGKKEVGELEFPKAEGASDSFALLFFDYWLRGAKNGWPQNKKYIMNDITESYSFVQFDNISSFTKSLNFDTISLYLGLGKHLIPGGPDPTDYSIMLTYDPKNPSPTIGGPTLRADLKQGPWNIRNEVLRRDDYVLFQDINGMPKIYGLFGKPKVDLFVSSDREDTDFAIRLCLHNGDLDSTNIIVSDGIYRMRFRDGFSLSDTQSMKNGEIYKVTFELPPLFIYPNMHDLKYTYISLVVTCSNYPRFDMNLNNGEDLYTSGDTLVAYNTIYYGQSYPSRLYFEGEYYLGSIQDNDVKNDIKIYPNPAFSELTIYPRNLQPPFNYSILDLQGREVMKGEVRESGTFTLDVSGLEPQVYVLKIESNGQSLTSKIVKID